MSPGKPQLSRRLLLESAAAGAGLVAAPFVWRCPAMAQDKPAELIVRAWGGVWVEALEKGVSKPFTEQTGIAVRHDLTEDNEIRPKIWAAVDQGRAPPIHVNWDTSTNATKSALRGVAEDLADLPNLKDMLPPARPAGFPGVPLINMYSYVYVMAYHDEAPADLVGDPAYPTTPEDFAKLLSVPTPILVEHEADWFQKFNEIMQG